MPQLEELAQLDEPKPEHFDQVIQTLTFPLTPQEGLAEVAHDARNMVTALNLYCDLLAEPGVLAAPFAHYGRELRLVAAASRRLIEKLVALDLESPTTGISPLSDRAPANSRDWHTVPICPILNLAEELLANRNLLACLAGPTIALTIEVEGGAVPVRMTAEDLTRILVNLVKNAAEAMSSVGRIHISLRQGCGEAADWATIHVEDNGPGLSEKALKKILDPHSSQIQSEDLPVGNHWPAARRGMGLAITRSLVESAGGAFHAANRDTVGACFQIELPVSKSLKLTALPPTQSRVIWPTHPE